ncbi:MAG: radical SAM protein [bacterium]|nr:radical SAM protein [bacterium]
MKLKVNKVNYGIRHDLQANVRHEPHACNGYTMDVSLGCAHRCIYCLFSPLELMIYKRFNPDYKGDVLPLKLDEFMEQEKFPPVVYMCYASDPLADEAAAQSSMAVLKKLFEHNVKILFITKGVFTNEMLDVIKIRPDLMEVQIGIANSDKKRNDIIEPGAPSYEERLRNFSRLKKIQGLGSLVVRIDPLFPVIDDRPENIEKIIKDVTALGVTEANLGYLVLSDEMKNSLQNNSYLNESMLALSERTPTVSTKESLFSFPFEQKVEKLEMFQEICGTYGATMTVCGCKDERLKKYSIPWVCHPYTRSGIHKEVSGENMPEWIFLNHGLRN